METTLGRATDEGFHENLSEAKTDKDDPLAAATTFEDLMRVASPRGRWALRVVVLCALGNLPGPSSSMTYQLVGATPDHWCRVAPLLRANWTDQQIITFAIPTRSDSEHLEGCVMRDYRYEAAATLGYEATLANASLLLASNDTLACPTRSFNHSQHQHTFVTEWDLVCGRRYLYSSSQAAVYLGSLFGSLLASLVLNITGRRPAVIVSCVLNIALSFVLAAAPNITVYIILKGVIETLQCLIYIATFMIAMEVCAPSQRNYVGALFMLPWSVGCMLMPGIAYLVQPWRWLQAVYTALFLGTLAYIWVLPESPRWLIHSGRHGEALRLLRRAAIADGATLPPDDRLLAAMATIMRRERPRAAAACPAEPSRSCLRRAYRYLLALVLTPGLRPKAAVVFYLWTVAGTSYYGLSHNAKILSTDVYLHAFLVGLVEVPALLCLWPAITYLGRRKTLAFLLTVCGASVALMTLLMVIRLEVPDAVKLLLSLNSKMTMTASYHLIWVFTVELFSTTNRVRLLGEASLVTRVTTVTVPYINDLLGDVFPWAPGALCSLAALVAAGLVFLLPETTNRKITQQDDSRLDALEETSQRFIDAKHCCLRSDPGMLHGEERKADLNKLNICC